jgi:HAMP domain-containing protein
MRSGEWIVLAGLIMLAVGSFLPWWTAPDLSAVQELTQELRQISPDAVIQAPESQVTLTMWHLEVLPWLVAIVLVSAGVLLLGTWFGKTPRLAVAASVPTGWFGLWASVAIAVRAFDEPVPGAQVEYGLYVSLAGAVLLWLGGWQSMRDERVPEVFEHSPKPERITLSQLDGYVSPHRPDARA